MDVLLLTDVQYATLAFPLGILKKMAYFSVKMIIWLLTEKPVKVVAKSLLDQLCWLVITNFIQNVLPVILAELSSGMARVTRLWKDLNYTAECATKGRCNHLAEQLIIRLLGNHIALDWWKYLLVQPIPISNEKLNLH